MTFLFDGTLPPYGWLYFILPYLGEEALYAQGNVDPKLYWPQFKDPPNEKAVAILQQTCATPVSTYLCSADPRDYSTPVYSPSFNQNVGMTSYLGVSGRSGSGFGEASAPNDIGVFGVDDNGIPLNVRMEQIMDGLSYTLMVGELPPDPENSRWPAFSWCTQPALGSWTVNIIQPTMIYPEAALPPPNAPCPFPAFFSPGYLNDWCSATHFWSFHTGGGNWLLCDGSALLHGILRRNHRSATDVHHSWRRRDSAL